jgi:bacillithiol system protein YtxJ
MTAEYAEKSEPFIPLTSADSLDELFKRSNDTPVILFKHSLTCSISSTAYQEMKKLTSEVSLIVMQNSRDISIELEKRTGIRHESPQVIIVRKGTAVWNASHWAITAEAVERAVNESA